jgi:hypothetical protein
MMSAHDIESQIQAQSLSFLDIRQDEAEHARLPMFADAFADYVEASGKMPTQLDFVLYYFQKNSKLVAPYHPKSVEARVRRAYPSLVRDYHFAALLSDAGLGNGYDRKTDVLMGVDHVVHYLGGTYYLHCFVATHGGHMWRDKKNNRHQMHGAHIDVEMDMSSDMCKRVGDFYLFSESHIDKLKRDIKATLVAPKVVDKKLELGDFL